jgi:hypothetical protein
MKKEFLNRLKTMAAPAALAVAMVALAPATALAAEHGGGRGSYGGRAPAARFSQGYGGRGYAYGGRAFYPGRVYGGPRFFRPGFGFGIGVGVYPAYGYVGPAYGYAPVYAPPPAACNPAGFYDQAGNWQYYQGCLPPQPVPNGDQGYGPAPNGDPNNGGPQNDPNYNPPPQQ